MSSYPRRDQVPPGYGAGGLDQIPPGYDGQGDAPPVYGGVPYGPYPGLDTPRVHGLDPGLVDPRLVDPRLVDPRLVDPRLVDPRLLMAGRGGQPSVRPRSARRRRVEEVEDEEETLSFYHKYTSGVESSILSTSPSLIRQ